MLRNANTTPVVLPSPNSAALFNLINENVDLYTGKTNLNLPIYNLKCGNISLPITLQSNINANKVNDIGTFSRARDEFKCRRHYYKSNEKFT